jgi:hypothetical protein
MPSTRNARSSTETGRQEKAQAKTPSAALPHWKIAQAAIVTSKLRGACATRHLTRRQKDETKRANKDMVRDLLERQLTHANGWNSLVLTGGKRTRTVEVCNTMNSRRSRWTRYAAQPLPAYCDAAELDLVGANAALVVERLDFLLEEQTRRRYSNSRPSIMSDVNVLNFASIPSFNDACLRYPPPPHPTPPPPSQSRLSI